MNNQHEPLDATAEDGRIGEDSQQTLRDSIQRLATQQDYAVLCVQGGGQPYGALVAFAFSEDLRHVTFATPTATRKFRLLSECDHIALVIDNRPNKVDEFMEVEAVTATGRAYLLKHGDEFDQWAKLLVSRHPYLKSFIAAPTCALFRVDIVRFFHVKRFQEVRQWVPTDHS